MFARLRLDRLVGRNDQQHQIDAAHPGQHVAHKPLVAGDVHKTNMQNLALRARQVHVGKAEINSDAAALLFLQPVGIDPSQCLDQSRLPVVDVSRGAYDHGFHLP